MDKRSPCSLYTALSVCMRKQHPPAFAGERHAVRSGLVTATIQRVLIAWTEVMFVLCVMLALLDTVRPGCLQVLLQAVARISEQEYKSCRVIADHGNTRSFYFQGSLQTSSIGAGGGYAFALHCGDRW